MINFWSGIDLSNFGFQIGLLKNHLKRISSDKPSRNIFLESKKTYFIFCNLETKTSTNLDKVNFLIHSYYLL